MNDIAYEPARYFPFGDSALLVELGNVISPALNQKVVVLAEAVENANIQGVEELVPTYRSLLIRFNPLRVSYEQLVFRIQDIEKTAKTSKKIVLSRKIVIPTVYGGEYGPDLAYVASNHRLTEEEVVKLHSEREYRVYMIGFVAGFPYLGEVADKIATPRLETPRLKVPAGSVSIAEKQSGIYPCEAPGGWRIIGRTPLQLFNPQQQPPAFLKPGDTVVFKPISEKKYKMLKASVKQKIQAGFKEKTMKIFKVLKPGLFTTVQDLGRYGRLKYGVPISGAMDQLSHIAANILVGNDIDAACLEMTLIGAELLALSKIQIAITGGEVSPKIDGVDVPMWQTLNVDEGCTISFGRMKSGCRIYLSVRGGINVPLVLGSRSTYRRGGFGGIDGRQLKAGDVIEAFKISLLENERIIPSELVPQFSNSIKAHVTLGPQAEMFTEEGIETFLSSQYKITLEADRMGYRLEGPQIKHKEKADIISDALLPGAVQVPKDGKPIIIMRDAQTTGGYPKIAVATTSDLCLLGQAKPNDMVEFEKVTIEEARKQFLEHCKLIDTLKRIFE